MIIWSVKSSLHTSNKSPELVTKLLIAVFNFEIFNSVYVSFFFLCLFFLFQILIIKSRFGYFTYVTNATNWNITGLVPDGKATSVAGKMYTKKINNTRLQ